MKRLTTYYFLLLAGFNVFFALCLSSATAKHGYLIKESLGTALPLPTQWILQYSWWPLAGAAVCAIGTVLSLLGRPKDNTLRNLLIVFLFVELGAMFLTAIAFIMVRF
ncbi:MAG: hypothetical protein FWG50_04750 [Kiritimatiellaeota bacterium]|nr:hypothetical protein [Kiritimatiellota bacterium]